AMTQPGVYFTLEAPFVRIIGLFSNALEDPGLISSEGQVWGAVPDYQLAFLEEQLKRIHDEQYPGAVLLAVHHPPFSYATAAAAGASGGNHGSSLAMLRQIDTICKAQGVYPHAVISGHAHNYQHYMRQVKLGKVEYDVPFVVCGNGGHNVVSLVRSKTAQKPQFGDSVKY